MAPQQPCMREFALLGTDADHGGNIQEGKTETVEGQWRSGGGGRRGHRDRKVEKLQEASGHEKEEGDTENEALLSLLMADCLPAIRAQS